MRPAGTFRNTLFFSSLQFVPYPLLDFISDFIVTLKK